jgi:hypothetical protein
MDVTYTPYYSVLAIIVLLIIPATFHLVAFRKSTQFIHVITSFLIGNLILTFIQEISGLIGTFDSWIILIFSLLLSGIIGYYVNKRDIFCDKNQRIISSKDILFVIGVAIFVFLYQKNTFPAYSNDTLSTYLPWARTIVDEKFIPAFHFGSNYRFTIHYPPLLYTNIAFLFSFFGKYNDSITMAVPIIYTSFFFLLITCFSKEYSETGEQLPFFILSLLLISPVFIRINFLLLQDPILMFYITSFFYFLFKYVKTKEFGFLILLSTSSVLSSLTKYTGQLIAIIILCVLIITWIKDKNEIRKVVIIFSTIHIPAILWAIRNLYFYGDVMYIESFSKLKVAGFISITSGLVGIESPATYQGMIIRVLGEFPVIVLTLIYFIKHWKEIEIRYVVSIYFIFMLVVYYTGSWTLIRYFIYPFLGIFILFAGIEISELYNKIHAKFLNRNERNTGYIPKMVSVILCAALIIFPAPISSMSDSPLPISEMSELNMSNYTEMINRLNPTTVYMKRVYNDESGILEYLQSKKENNMIVLGDYNYKCNWYGDNCTSLTPDAVSFSVINKEEPFNFTKNSDYIYARLKKIGISYIYDSPIIEIGWERLLFYKINNDHDHFELVYNRKGYRLWEVK